MSSVLVDSGAKFRRRFEKDLFERGKGDVAGEVISLTFHFEYGLGGFCGGRGFQRQLIIAVDTDSVAVAVLGFQSNAGALADQAPFAHDDNVVG